VADCGDHTRLHGGESVYRALLENMPLVAWVADVDTGRTFYVNGQIHRLLGYSPLEWTNDVGLQRRSVYEEDRAVVAEHEARVRARGGSECEFRLVARDGKPVWVHEQAVLVQDGARSHVQGFTLGIGDRKRTEEALRASEERYRLIVETAAEGVCVLDAAGITTFVNDAFAQMLGLTVEESLGRPVYDFVAEELHAATAANLARLRRGERTQFERRLVGAGGRVVDALLTSSPLTTAEGDRCGSLAIVTDITERKRLKRELEDARQLEAIGSLAGGVAHDFNNSMMAIRGFAELLLGRLDPDDPARRDAEGIKQAADGAAALTRQLLAFGRRQVLQPEVLDVNDVIRALEPLLRRRLRDGIELELDLSGELRAVSVDPEQFEQVILELTKNAVDAMPVGGRITIRTAEQAPGATVQPFGQPVETGAYALIAVCDQGHGIAEDVRERVLEPFFSTKELGRGGGMGLPTVYGIVKQSGGYFGIETEVGEGSTFEIYLPLAEAQASAQDRSRHIAEAEAAETVLLVEDDDVVRTVVAEMLEQLGRRVLQAKAPERALELAADEAIDVLLTDVVMPGLSGPELAARLQELRPDLRVLLMSGYTRGSIGPDDGDLGADTAYLQKPFSLDVLQEKLESLGERRRVALEVAT
jgi:two-component system, cell cycle sensor histidine kinase and response regulator CckA